MRHHADNLSLVAGFKVQDTGSLLLVTGCYCQYSIICSCLNLIMRLWEMNLDQIWQFHPDVALGFTQIPEMTYPAWVKCDNWRKAKTSQNVNSSGIINLAVPICNTSPSSNRAQGFLQHRGSFCLDGHNHDISQLSIRPSKSWYHRL